MQSSIDVFIRKNKLLTIKAIGAIVGFILFAIHLERGLSCENILSW